MEYQEKVQGVKVSMDIPSEVIQGSSFLVTLLITKGDLNSFAKFQQQLPTGLVAKPIKTQNAHFSFNAPTVKVIWDKLPDTNHIIKVE